MSEMPTFKFDQSSVKTDDEFIAAGGGEKTSKFLKPGRYDATLVALEYQGLSKDPNWGKMMAVYRTSTGGEIRDYFMIPFVDHLYGEKRSAFPFKKLQKIAAAYGQELSISNSGTVLKTLFTKPELLVGTPIVIEVGYEGGFVHYAGKNQDGGKRYQLFGSDKNAVRDPATMAPLEFPDIAATEVFATANGIPFDKFPRILSVHRSAAARSPAQISW